MPTHFETPDLILIGLSHTTASLTLREQLALTSDERHQALLDLQARQLAEVVMISTCNRLEIYAVTDDASTGLATIAQFIADLRQLSLDQLRPYLYQASGNDAVTHLMRVAAGTESMILGEQQILGQVQTALATAQAQQVVGPLLTHLFTQAVHAGKRARHETEISRHITSISHAAAHLAQAETEDFEAATALVVGSGEMAYLAAQALHRFGIGNLQCINRTAARAALLATAFDGEALEWDALPTALATADVVITATAAPHAVIRQHHLEAAVAERHHTPLVIIDIALPRDVETSPLPGLRYHDLDDLKTFVAANVARREAAITDVERIVTAEAERFADWFNGRSVVPVISALREKATAVAQDEVDVALRRLGDLDATQQQVVERLAHRIVNKILHDPTTRLKAETDYADVVRDLFALEFDLTPSPLSKLERGSRTE